ncbi:MAG: S-layer homology domain-containing protein [Clostridiaceae bacterium]|nr:S-layer homology domain-containing protein [Clostridiaceae bacterium]
MKKRILSVFVLLCLMLSLLSAFAVVQAQDTPAATEEQTVRALGIMNGDENGDMKLSGNVTRAEFAKMMVAASIYKNDVGKNTNLLLYRDLKQSHWAVGYIKVAVDNGWFMGYADGSFRPDNTITLEEAATALLRLLGYTEESLTGTYPSAQLAKFKALGLGDGITKAQGQVVLRSDCVMIFYNLMNTAAKNGTVYANTLGYTLNSDGKLDYTSLVYADMNGPFVLESGDSLESLLPFSSVNTEVYKNGDTDVLSSASVYDVYYYNTNLRTVWIYDKKVSGTYTAVSPSSVTPSSVTVAGNSYSIGTSKAAYKLSSMGGFSAGDTITLLLGMNGTVVDAVKASDVSGIYYGVVTEKQMQSYTDNNGKVVSEDVIKVACTDGAVRQYAGSASVGSLVSVNYCEGKTKVVYLNQKSIRGNVNSQATMMGSLSFSKDIEILDTNTNGNFTLIYPSRLAGATLQSGDVRYYVLDKNGDISRLILSDVTGDLYAYGLITKSQEYHMSMTVNSYYEYIINGQSGVLSSATTLYNVSEGGAIFRYKDGSIDSIKNLKSVSINSVNELYAMNGNNKYLMADNVQVYEKIDDSYSLSNISTIANTDKYTLRGYFDDFGYNAGGRLRVIIATAKSN